MKKVVFFMSIVLCLAMSATVSQAVMDDMIQDGGTTFVPAMYNSFPKGAVGLSMLVIHNVSQWDLKLDSVAFYDPSGNLVEEYITTPPM